MNNMSLKLPIKKLVVKAKITKKDFELIKADLIGATKAESVVFEVLPEKSEMDFESDVGV